MDEEGEAIVFRQFGRYLSGQPNEPIIDQHVLRAFAVYRYRENVAVAERYQQLRAVTHKNKELVREYKDWLSGG